MRQYPWARLTALLVVSALLFGACGGTATPSPSQSTAPSSAQSSASTPPPSAGSPSPNTAACTGPTPDSPVTFPGEWRPDAIELYQFYVLGAWHGQGVAQELMAWALEHARSHGAKEIILSVYVDNHRAHRFYEKYGFEDIGRIAFRVGETVDDDNLMRLAL